MKNYPPTYKLAKQNGNRARQAAPPARVKREAIERTFRIHELVAAGKFPNIQTLAVEFEISPKTVKRDFQFMRDRLDLPLEYDRQRHGFYYSKPVDKFPGSPKVTESELFALLVAHKAIEQYKGTPFYQPLLMAFAKLTCQLDKKERYTAESIQEALSFRPFGAEDTDVETFQIVTRARCRTIARSNSTTVNLDKRTPKCVTSIRIT
jgi:proteasome accessory factor B